VSNNPAQSARAVLIIFPLNLQTITMLSSREERAIVSRTYHSSVKDNLKVEVITKRNVP